MYSDNVGWKEYMTENIEEFHDVPLVWESGSKVGCSASETYIVLLGQKTQCYNLILIKE